MGAFSGWLKRISGCGLDGIEWRASAEGIELRLHIRK